MSEPAACNICPHRCRIPDGASGFCGVRGNRGGKVRYEGYGRVSSAALDPVEKKPLYLFHPGKMILSVGGFGCNLRCPFCQNCHISIEHRDGWQKAEYTPPEKIAALAGQTVANGNIGVAYTYNEPLVGYEFVFDCARLVRAAGLCNVLVTNGYVNGEPLRELLPFIDAVNIDLKGFSEPFYNKLGGRLEPVLEAITTAHKHCHVEVTTLVIPGENEDDIETLAKWVASVDPEIPLHLTRFFPRYKYMDREPAPRETVSALREKAGRYLKYVFG
jgi:pyruvate formate lyase activating enzyme